MQGMLILIRIGVLVPIVSLNQSVLFKKVGSFLFLVNKNKKKQFAYCDKNNVLQASPTKL
jgi:hypothetical protein